MAKIKKLYYAPSDMTQIDQAITQLEGYLSPKFVTLKATDRQRYGSINEKNKLLVNKSMDILRDQPQFAPPLLDVTEFQQDFDARQFLESRIIRLQMLINGLLSNKIIHDFDNYRASLVLYDYLQLLQKAEMAGASELINEMRQFFSRTKNTNTPTDPTTPDM